MQVPADIKKRIKTELDRLAAVASAHYGRDFKVPPVVYDLKGRAAGMACMVWKTKRMKIRFNPILLMENVDDFVSRTVPHELAHILDYVMNEEKFVKRRGQKRSVHGPRFQSIMYAMGASDATRCHEYDTTNSRKAANTQTHDYRCSCGDVVKLGPKQHNKQRRGQTNYKHKVCFNSVLSYIGPTGSPTASSIPSTPKTGEKKVSKQSQANDIFARLPSTSRKAIINMIVNELGVGEAYASTLYAKAKKAKGSQTPTATNPTLSIPNPTSPIPTHQNITKFDKTNLDEVRAVIDKAVNAALANLGLSADAGNIRYSSKDFKLQLSVHIGTQSDADKREWDLYCLRIGLEPKHFGTTFQSNGTTFTVSGIAPRSSKRPVLATNASGTVYKFPAEKLGGGRKSFSFDD